MKSEEYKDGKVVKSIENDGTNIIVKDNKGNVTSTMPCTPEQIAEYQNWVQGNNESEVQRQVDIAMTRLDQIATASSATNAQMLQAIKDMAKIQRRVIRLLTSKFDGSD